MKKVLILVLLTALCFFVISGCTVKPSIEQPQNSETPTKTDAQTALPTSPAPTDDRTILYGTDDDIDEGMPNPGEVMLSGGVGAALQNSDNGNALLYVELRCCSDSDQNFYETFTFEGKSRKEWYASLEDITHEYDDGYWALFVEEEAKIDWDTIETSEQKEAALATIRQAWDEIWNETHNIHPLTEGLRFEAAFQTAQFGRRNARVQAEYERLTSLALDVSTKTAVFEDDHGNVYEYFYLIGYLTATQIDNFPCGNYGYIISWADRDDVIDE